VTLEFKNICTEYITVSVLANQNCNVWAIHREMQTEIYNRFYM
jgi:hypothetical protein